MAEALIKEHGADVENPTSEGRTPLHIACSRADLKLANMLIKNPRETLDKKTQVRPGGVGMDW